MAIEPEQSILDLTTRTATADSDLIHVNSGGTDYKETKRNFLQGDFYHEFANDSSLTSQVDALPEGGYLGKVNGGTITVTGTPANTSYYVEVQKSSANYASIRLRSYSAGGYPFHKHKVNGTWASEWTPEPYRDEITSLNNSLSQLSNKFAYRDYSVTTGTSLYSTFYYGDKSVDTSLGEIVSIAILSTSSNQAAFASVVSRTNVRVFSPAQNNVVGVRVLFMSS